MDKMLKNNNSMTVICLILLCISCGYGYTNNQAISKNAEIANRRFDHIEAALHYKLNIDIEDPYRSSNSSKDSSRVLLHRDALLANNKITVVQKDNE